MKNCLFLILMLVSSCAPKFEKALQVVTKTSSSATVTAEEIHAKYPKVTANASNRWFPVKETEVIPGSEVVTETEIEEERPLVYQPCHEGEVIPCPPNRIITRTVTRVDTIRVNDIKQLIAEQLAHRQTVDSLSKYKAEYYSTVKDLGVVTVERDAVNKEYGWMKIGLIGFILVVVAIVVYKLFRK